MAELVKHIDTHIEMDFMMASSYHGGTASSGVDQYQARRDSRYQRKT